MATKNLLFQEGEGFVCCKRKTGIKMRTHIIGGSNICGKNTVSRKDS